MLVENATWPTCENSCGIKKIKNKKYLKKFNLILRKSKTPMLTKKKEKKRNPLSLLTSLLLLLS